VQWSFSSPRSSEMKIYEWKTAIACAIVYWDPRRQTAFRIYRSVCSCSISKLMRYTWSVTTYFLLYTLCKLWMAGYSLLLLIQPYQLPVSGVFVSCLTDKRPPDAPSGLRYSPSVGKEERKGCVVIVAFRKANRNSQFYCRCWKCWLPDRT